MRRTREINTIPPRDGEGARGSGIEGAGIIRGNPRNSYPIHTPDYNTGNGESQEFWRLLSDFPLAGDFSGAAAGEAERRFFRCNRKNLLFF